MGVAVVYDSDGGIKRVERSILVSRRNTTTKEVLRPDQAREHEVDWPVTEIQGIV